MLLSDFSRKLIHLPIVLELVCVDALDASDSFNLALLTSKTFMLVLSSSLTSWYRPLALVFC